MASAGMPTISLAPAFAINTTPSASTITSASSDFCTWSDRAPYSHSGVSCNCSMYRSTLIVDPRWFGKGRPHL